MAELSEAIAKAPSNLPPTLPAKRSESDPYAAAAAAVQAIIKRKRT